MENAPSLSRRIFIGFPISPEKCVDLQNALEAAKVPDRLRTSRPEKWHITLLFLGDVPEAKLPSLRQLFRQYEESLPTLSLPLSLSSLGGFPSPSRARVFWVGPETVPDRLEQIRDEVTSLVQQAGLAVPDLERAFRPHLSLSRLKRPENLRRALPELALIPEVSLPLESLHLIESRFVKGGTEYETLERVHFSR